MSDKLSETIHSEYCNALVIEKALSYMVNRTSGTDRFLLEEWNKSSMRVREAKATYAQKKKNMVKLLSPQYVSQFEVEDD
jgi:hypothetical protein